MSRSNVQPRTVALTDQQHAVVQHDHGPALVFAVAGAGKTTAMVHRIERLVRERLFAPEQILATSFGKANERDMRRALARWPHCATVHVSTLHALGYDIVRQAQAQGLLPAVEQGDEADRPNDAAPKIEHLDHHILNITLAEAFRQDVPYRADLNGIDRQDFLDYVGRCKNNLAYADLAAARLPAAARAHATQAEPPSALLDWYLDLYKRYEAVRRRHGWVTFDDMLLVSWEMLHRSPALLAAQQARFACVLVDEFQDINLVQAEILDMLTAPHRNFMAIGDDDQTIYEWRGAQPHFILTFAERYQATTYAITDNFRCPAAAVVLANAVIVHNQRRQPKQLNLTKGFDGSAHLHLDGSLESMAAHIARRISSLHENGRRWQEVAVLVRLNAQTPFIEQEFIARRIPYHVSKPFYERLEIETLIGYCRLAWLEGQLAEGRGLTAAQRQAWEAAWQLAANRPKRYLSRDARQAIRDAVIGRRRPLADTLRHAAETADREYLREKLLWLADDLAWLAGRLDADAHATLKELDARLAFQDFLRDSSGSPVTGEGRAASVAAFIAFAEGHGSLARFLGHIRTLAVERAGRQRSSDAVTLTTIHQAKGLEWPIVFVPQVNQSVLPYTGSLSQAPNFEEERRLFYVAITRTEEQLHLHTVRTEPPSQFLVESQAAQTLVDVNRLGELLGRPQLDSADALALARAARRFGLERYFSHYHRPNGAVSDVARLVQAARRADALGHLGLTDADSALWTALVPVAADEPLPDIAPLLPGHTLPGGAPTAAMAPTAAVAPTDGAPAIVRRGVWVECDAGWGEIRWIEDQKGKYVPIMPADNRRHRLFVRLRTADGELPVVVDLLNARVEYPDLPGLRAFPREQPLTRLRYHRHGPDAPG